MTSSHLRHVDVWAGVLGFTFGCAGELCFTVEEWPTMRDLLTRSGERVEIIEREKEPAWANC